MNFGFIDCADDSNDQEQENTIEDVLRKNSNEIMLEPRLQEYLNKQHYNQIYKTTPQIPLEREYLITNNDKQIINSYLRGDKEIYSQQPLETVTPKKMMFPSSKFKYDPRMDKLKKKLEKEKDAQVSRHNYENYEYNFADSILPKQQNDAFSEQLFLDSKNQNQENRYSVNYAPDKLIKQHVSPQLQYKQKQPSERMDRPIKYMDHNAQTNKIINKLDNYVNHTNTIYHSNSEMDTEQRIQKPQKGTEGNCPYTNNNKYQPTPYAGTKAGLLDTNVETDMKCGYPNNKFKSLGFKNPSEHYFDYINPDLQTAAHTVIPGVPRGGVDTRALNHKKVRTTVQREVM